MTDITELLDLLNSTTGELWRDACDELLEAGYAWAWVFSREGNVAFHLIDLFDSEYFV